MMEPNTGENNRCSATAPDNRRQHNRVDVQWRARLLKKGNNVASAVVKNASLGGVFVETTIPFQVHDRVLLEMHLSDHAQAHRIVCEAEVMRKTQVEERYGLGLRFTRIDDGDLTHLLAIIAGAWSHGETV